MSERPQPLRWRCLTAGCNPVLDEHSAKVHTFDTGHRTAKWPVRSKAGQRKAQQRNRSGYYDQYNVGAKAPELRFGGGDRPDSMRGISYGEAHPEEWK